jgi:hypothetical protein
MIFFIAKCQAPEYEKFSFGIFFIFYKIGKSFTKFKRCFIKRMVYEQQRNKREFCQFF